MIDQNKLAWEIYAILKEKGAEIGNASVPIIENTIRQHIENEKDMPLQKSFNKESVIDYFNAHPKLSNNRKIGLIKSIRILYNLGLPQALELYKKHFEEA